MKQWHMINGEVYHFSSIQLIWFFSNNVSGFIGRKWNQCYILYMFSQAVSLFFDDRREIRVRQSCLNATNLTDLHSFYSTSKLYFIRFHWIQSGHVTQSMTKSYVSAHSCRLNTYAITVLSLIFPSFGFVLKWKSNIIIIL